MACVSHVDTRERPALTAERFVPDPFAVEPGGRLYRTGDLGRLLPSGDVEFLGRVDDQLKIDGYRVEPTEVAHALCAHPGVRDAVVVGDTSAGRPALVAYAVPTAGTPRRPPRCASSWPSGCPGIWCRRRSATSRRSR